MPRDFTIETTNNNYTICPAVTTAVGYLNDLGKTFKVFYNGVADSCTIEFRPPLDDHRVSQMLVSMGWRGTNSAMRLERISSYIPKYQSPLYPQMDGESVYLVNTGVEMVPYPATDPIKTVSD